MSTGKALKYYRKKKKYLQRDVAKYLQIRESTYQSYETDKSQIRLFYVYKLEKFLDLKVIEFYKKAEELDE